MESGEFVNVSREKASKDESRIIHREATWTTMDPDLVVVRYDFTECSYENSFIPNYDELAGLNDPAGLITNPIIFCCLSSIKDLWKSAFPSNTKSRFALVVSRYLCALRSLLVRPGTAQDIFSRPWRGSQCKIEGSW